MDTTQHDLKILSICYYIMGGIQAAMALLLLAYGVFFGIFLSMIPDNGSTQSLPPAVAHLMMGIFSVMAALGVAYAGCVLLAGRFLARRKHYVFCFVAAVLNCLLLPFGTVLGIFTFIVLSRPGVRESFGNPPRAKIPPPLPIAEPGAEARY